MPLLKVIVLCRKIMNYMYLKIYSLLVYLTSFTVCSGDIKKEKKKSSENDQGPKSEKKFP